MTGINNEKDFEEYIRNNIIPVALPNSKYKLFEFKKAVDILIAKNGNNPKLFFIEIKYHKSNHGRLGFGQRKGIGFQPEVLKDKTDYFENNLRWILGNEESENFWFIDSNKIRQYIGGGEVGKKYNNIQTSFFKKEQSISKIELINQLKDWLNK